jgi:hypothetical protein
MLISGLTCNDPWPVAVHHQYLFAGADIEEGDA